MELILIALIFIALSFSKAKRPARLTLEEEAQISFVQPTANKSFRTFYDGDLNLYNVGRSAMLATTDGKCFLLKSDSDFEFAKTLVTRPSGERFTIHAPAKITVDGLVEFRLVPCAQ